MTTTATALTILASAVIVLGGLTALVRAIWKVAQTLRDNTVATKVLTGKLENMAGSVDGRFDALAERVAALEGRKQS